jgi:hypothetical protein
VTTSRRPDRSAKLSRPRGGSRLGRALGLEAPTGTVGVPVDATPPDRRTTIVFISSILLLILFHYFGKPESYRESSLNPSLMPLATDWFGSHADIAPYVSWAVMSIVLRVAIPFALIVFVFREPLAAYGWKWRGQLPHIPKYLLLYVAMLPLLLWASTLPSFQIRYPFYQPAAAGGAVFWGYELLYGLQFVGVETFFRGFMTFALYRRFGYNGLFIMAIPYVMVHFNKPLPETLGALGAALILGFLALRAGSCVLGIFLHWGVGATMDFLGVARSAGGIGAALRAIF